MRDWRRSSRNTFGRPSIYLLSQQKDVATRYYVAGACVVRGPECTEARARAACLGAQHVGARPPVTARRRNPWVLLATSQHGRASTPGKAGLNCLSPATKLRRSDVRRGLLCQLEGFANRRWVHVWVRDCRVLRNAFRVLGTHLGTMGTRKGRLVKNRPLVSH